MSTDTKKLRQAATSAKEFASVGVVTHPHTAKAHINGLADVITTCCGEIDAQAAEIERLRGALEAMLEIHGVTQSYAETHIEIPQSWVEVSDIARAALSGESNAQG